MYAKCPGGFQLTGLLQSGQDSALLLSLGRVRGRGSLFCVFYLFHVSLCTLLQRWFTFMLASTVQSKAGGWSCSHLCFYWAVTLYFAASPNPQRTGWRLCWMCLLNCYKPWFELYFTGTNTAETTWTSGGEALQEAVSGQQWPDLSWLWGTGTPSSLSCPEGPPEQMEPKVMH